MNVVGFAGYSGSGKTTLVESMVSLMCLAGQRVSVIKHAHHSFDIDHPGKDSYRHRAAGAYEVVVASDRRLAMIREYDVRTEPTPHQLIAELSECDWVLVEGFKHGALLKIEVWRAESGSPVQYPTDPKVVAICTDSPDRLPQATSLPLLDLNNPDEVRRYLLTHAKRFEYERPVASAV